jgi:hypothetical protein
MDRILHRRISYLEQSLPGALTAVRFITIARRQACRYRGTFESSVAKLVTDLTDDELNSLTAQFETLVFGSDRGHRDAFFPIA